MIHYLQKAAAVTALTMSSLATQAEIFWSDISITYLYGEDYVQPFFPKGEESKGQVYTLEHAGAYNFGKSFFFVDRFNSGDKSINNDDTYMELGVDLSLSWLGGTKLENSAIKDLYIATQWENANPEGFESTDNILAGVGVSWKVPGFVFFDTNVYYRMNENTKQNFQLTTAWKLPFAIASTKWVFSGFFDLTSETETLNGGFEEPIVFHTQPQLKLDVGDFWGDSDTFYFGVELDYWKNKFGQEGEDQLAPQLLVQVHF